MPEPIYGDELLADPAFQRLLDVLINEKIAYLADVVVPVLDPDDPDQEDLPLPNPNPGASVSCHTPIVMPPSGSTTATFTRELSLGGPSPNRLPGVPPDSQYQVNDSSGDIWMIPAFIDGQEAFAFCVDHGIAAPRGTYGSISIDAALGSFSRAVQLAVVFVMANVPALPSDDATEFWDMIGLDCAENFNGWDAWAVSRYVVFALLNELPGGIARLEFIGTPKAPCLQQAAQVLYELAMSYGNGTLDCGDGALGGASGAAAVCCNSACGSGGFCGGSGTCGGCGCAADKCTCNDPCGLRMGCQLGKVFSCNTSQPVTDRSSTYLIFTGCPNDIRECCGRVVLGPFKLQSSNRGTPSLSLVPCNGCPGADIQITDFCCNILAEPPAVGDEFYIAFRPPSCRYCFDLCAQMETSSRAVYFFRRPGAPNRQRVAIPFGRTERRTTCIHICIDITPEQPPPGPEPWWEHVLVNNNNNNNNNDSSNNDNNANNNSNLLSNLLNNLLNSMMNGNLLGGLQSGDMLGSGMLGGAMSSGGFAGAGPGFPGFWPGPFPWGLFPPGPFPPGPFPPGPEPNRPPLDGRFPFPWGLFPPGTTPCPPSDCGGPNPCCCPPPCPPPCCCPPPCPLCPPPCAPWPLPCPEPCFLPPAPYIPEPSFIIQPAIPTYQAMPMPAPYFSPPPWPPAPQPFPFNSQPYPSYPSYQQWDGAQPPVQINPVTVVVPPADPSPVMMAPDPAFYAGYSGEFAMPPETPYYPGGDPWLQYSAPWPSAPPMPPAPPPYSPPPPEPMPPLLPEFSSAPRPDFPAMQEDAQFDEFYWDWYGQ